MKKPVNTLIAAIKKRCENPSLNEFTCVITAGAK
jgi:hypothetical protein